MHGKARGKDVPENPKAKVLRRENTGKEARQDPIRENVLRDTIAKGDILRAKEPLDVKGKATGAANGDTPRAKALLPDVKAEVTKVEKGGIHHAKEPPGKAATAKGDAKALPGAKAKDRGHHIQAENGDILPVVNSAARLGKADTVVLQEKVEADTRQGSRTTAADTTARCNAIRAAAVSLTSAHDS